jgi:hypothetical protein
VPAVQPLPDARCWAGNRRLDTGARCVEVARARALATSGPSSQSAPRTAMSAWGPAEEVDEGVERHGADWQGIKEPYQLELMSSIWTRSGHGVTMLSGRRMLSGQDGSVLLDNPNAYLGRVLKGRGVPNDGV